MSTLQTRDEETVISEGTGAAAGRGLSDNPVLGRPLGWLAQIRHFWHEIALEMRRVSWPARNEVVSTTVIVIVAVFFFAAYLFAADIIFTYIIEGLEWGASRLFG
ncbi:MAG: preprotein translocase subunit SecE [Acidobacteria bacterium]|nr:preprotein translocase subunit SecE [Acidobacteriota bacterium]